MSYGINERIIYLRKKILIWFKENGRNYPWRSTRDPFKILIAEIMLRRTRSEQVVPIYEEFFEKFSDIDSVAEADEKYIAEIVKPLGLRWRAPQFKMIAKELKEKYDYRIPNKREEIMSLSGVGEYVAGAVLATAFNKKEWVVDVNIVRVFSRFFCVKTKADGRRNKNIIKISKIYISCREPGKAVMGILDFAAKVCKNLNPDCKICPIKKRCYFFLNISD